MAEAVINSQPIEVESLVIRASAGSGKTFSLTNRFIALLALNVPADRILATTFTRKAAGEIRARIFTRLARAALSTSESERLYQEICSDFAQNISPKPDFSQLLQRLVSCQHRLSIGTLDSYFIKAARCFSSELELPQNWSIAEEIELNRQRLEAIAQVLGQNSSSEISALIQLITNRALGRTVIDQIRRETAELEDVFRQTGPAAWAWLESSGGFTDKKVAQLIASLSSVIDALELEEKPNGQFIKGLRTLIATAQAGTWQKFLGTTLVSNIGDENPTYYRKKVPLEIIELIRELAEHAKLVALLALRNQTLSAYALNQKFHGKFERLKDESGLLGFSDISWRLSQAAISAQIPEFYYRLDSVAAHVLLDEFQDTSISQWQIILPLIEEVLQDSTNRTFFCVGDVKQAIYGWRGGRAEIFNDLLARFENLTEKTLDKSWRSSPIIIDFVNQLFSSLPQTFWASKHCEAVEQWILGFSPHQTSKTDLPGYVQVSISGVAEGSSQQKMVNLEEAAQLARQLVLECPDKTIGILLRKNDTVRQLLTILRSDSVAVDASEEGGNPLTDSSAVRVMLALLTIADSPLDTSARYLLSISPLWSQTKISDFFNHSQVEQFAGEIRQELQLNGYGATLEQWSTGLYSSISEKDYIRLQQLLELAYRYDANAAVRPIEFVELVSKTKLEAPSDALVRVMTIHKAKGLEFDIVILPELDATLESVERAKVLADYPNPLDPPHRVIRYPNKEIRKLDSRLAQMHSQTVNTQIRESLSLLYVAVTRARQAMYIILSPTKSKRATLETLVKQSLEIEGSSEGEQVEYQHGSADWYQLAGTPEATSENPPQLKTSSNARPKQIVFLPDKSNEGKQQATGSSVLNPSKLPDSLRDSAAGATTRKTPFGDSMSNPDGTKQADKRAQKQIQKQALLRGEILHAFFQQVNWLDEQTLETESLISALPSKFARDPLAVPLLAQFAAMLEQPAIRTLLSKTGYQLLPGQELILETELNFITRNGSSRVRGTFDRLVVCRTGTEIVWAEVIDYKTGAFEFHDQTRAVEFYRPQLESYISAAMNLLGLPQSKVFAKLALLDAGAVLDICVLSAKVRN